MRLSVSALMWPAHDLQGVLDMTPLARLVRIALVFAGAGVLRGAGDGLESMLFGHLARDGVNLRYRRHDCSPGCSLPHGNNQDDALAGHRFRNGRDLIMLGRSSSNPRRKS